jgi:hypothetical protein
MSLSNKIKEEINTCLKEAGPILLYLNGELDSEKDKKFIFQFEYQNWYTKALKIVEIFGHERLSEFKGYYEIDSKRKKMGFGTYYIQDYIKGIVPGSYSEYEFNSKKQTFNNVFNQYTILFSINERVDLRINDIKTNLFVEIQDIEIETARKLLKVNVRASGVIAGVVLESYLTGISKSKEIVVKKNATLYDLSEVLKNKEVIDITIWEKIKLFRRLKESMCA